MRREDDEVSYEGIKQNKCIAMSLLCIRFFISIQVFFLNSSSCYCCCFISLTTNQVYARWTETRRHDKSATPTASSLIVRDIVTTFILSKNENLCILVDKWIHLCSRTQIKSVVIIVSVAAKIYNSVLHFMRSLLRVDKHC